MKKTNFMNATFVNVTFRGFDFTNMNLMNTKFIGCKFDNCITDNEALFMNSELINCDFIGVSPKRPAPSIAELLKPEKSFEADGNDYDVADPITEILKKSAENGVLQEVITWALSEKGRDSSKSDFECLYNGFYEWNK